MADATIDELEARPKEPVASEQLLQGTAPLVFIHSAHRTSSTWFWSKFRELPSTQCYYEPFNFTLQWITSEKASWLGGDSWDSRHGPTKPYYLEYAPLIRPNGGVDLFDPAMTMQWFIPVGGLRGELRGSEQEYLTQLVRLAEKARKFPVFGEVWSLGRLWAIKQALGGFHIFQYRNLWPQWLSHLFYKQVKGSRTFYCSILDTIFRDDDPYFQWLVEHGLELANDPHTGQDPKASPLWWNRSYANFERDEDKVRRLELLPEPRVFSLFMGMRVYLYLHAQLCADLTADATRMQRDARYRADIEQAIRQHTGLAVSFADVADLDRPSGVEFDRGAVDWDEVREYARVAVEMVSKFGDPAQLIASAAALVDETIEEARKDDLRSAASDSGAAPETPPEVSQAPVASEAAPAPEESSVITQAAQARTVGLCMIVKNETAMIRRCLASVLPLIDYVLVVDTGSTDGTQQIIREFLTEHNVAGAVIDEPWRDFAYNRSFAMERLREVASVDYAMVIDADDTLEFDAGFDPRAFKAELTHDLYYVPVRHGGIVHHRPQLFSNRLPFSFKGVLHEYLEAPPGELSRETVKGFAVHASTGGARSQNPRKYQDDAEVLERALVTERDPFLISRYTFYLAQSYRDSGEREKALNNYLKRAELGYWDEEVYVSLFEAGNMMAALDRPFEEVIATYERAAQKVPARAEALHAAAHYCRSKGKNAEGMEFARRGIDLTQPNGLFVQHWVYDYAILDEFAINAYWAGAYRESLDACLKLLASDKLPASMAKRIAANARFAFDKLPAAKAPNLGALGAEDMIQQHALVPQRPLHSCVKDSPRILLGILAKQKEPALPLYLDCIEALDYPKSSIALYIRTNNNTDRTEEILRDWVARVGHLYNSVEFDASNVTEQVEQYREHEWNATRFSVLGRIRNQSMRRALELDCDFYFVADVDNFIRPATLRELVALDLPIASPLLRSIAPGQYYSNYHAEIDTNGYYMNCDQYQWLLERRVRGLVEVPVVHCTYLVRADVIPKLAYEDASGRHEYVVFSDSARKASVPQYVDNRQVYGYITFGEDDDHHVAGGIEQARALLSEDLRTRPSIKQETRTATHLLPTSSDGTSPPRLTSQTVRPKALIFCTAFASTPNAWESRYRRWLRAIHSSQLEYDAILMVDDGSPVLPEWTDIAIGTGEIDQLPAEKILLYHFEEHLGRKAIFDFPGWYRSFAFAGRYAHARGFEKVVHIESDAFLIQSRVQRYVNNVVSGWTALWCPVHSLPESAIQVIAGDAIRKFADLPRTHPHEKLIGREFELQLPFDMVEKRFIGDRYGEFQAFVPGNAEYAVQARDGQPEDYYWWLTDEFLEASKRGYSRRALGQRRAASVADGDLSIHLINLDRSVDRLTAFRKRNAHLRNVVRVPAIDGSRLNRDELVKDGVLAPDCEYTAGALGCALSHMKLWEKAIAQGRPITIFEDDIAVSYQFEQSAADILATLPMDWDVMVWGFHLNPLFVWVDLCISKAKLSGYGAKPFPKANGIEQFQAQEFRGGPVRLLHSFGACAYSISPSGARAATRYCRPLRHRLIEFPEADVITPDYGIDAALSGLYPSLRAFICMPPLVRPYDAQISDREQIDVEAAHGK